MLHQCKQSDVRRCAGGRVSGSLPVGVLERFDRRVRRHVPVKVARPGRSGRQNAHGRAFCVRAHHGLRARGDADIDAAGNHGLHRLAAALSVQNLELQTVLGEDAGALADLGNTGVPIVRSTDRELQLIGGLRDAGERQQSAGEDKRSSYPRNHESSLYGIRIYPREHLMTCASWADPKILAMRRP